MGAQVAPNGTVKLVPFFAGIGTRFFRKSRTARLALVQTPGTADANRQWPLDARCQNLDRCEFLP